MSGLVLCEPTELYNILNQATIYPCLSDTNYLLLLDARKKHEYNESHVVTAKKAPKSEDDEFVVPYDSELECKQHVIIYDSNTRSLKDEGPAIECGKVMWDNGSRGEVKILRGGYEDFSALYPFLRTQKILFMPREMDEIKTYPTEVLPGLLYLGNKRQGNAAYIQKDLKIKAQINCTTEEGELFKEPGPTLMHIPVDDDEESDLLSKFESVCTFIDEHKGNKRNVLVFSDLGISRSITIILAYLMHHYKWPLKEAYEHCKKCCHNIRPNRGFVHQLSKWEEELYGQTQTDISDPNF
ncbi:serine/threonine/tyrosine-interacting-like protein 1 [Lineus longissimus]|uniref:serine/threonine/tyrosine-interacting-like protein 1 n=1 Tax=Lineus longissimus TaxID=88925 RepID=UPI002B4D6428